MVILAEQLLALLRRGSESLRHQPGKTRDFPQLLKSEPRSSILVDRWACLEARPNQQVHLAKDEGYIMGGTRGQFKPDAPLVQLYNLATDLSQAANLAAKDPPHVKAMKKRLEELTARPMYAAVTWPRLPLPIELK
jgi:hypothetical protein